MTRVRRLLIAFALAATGLGMSVAGSAAHAATVPSPAAATPQAYGVCVADPTVWLLNFCAL
ncbi:MAG: hypothetical protein NVSMB12_11840 [Acidimicrobiales bacterium]